MKIPSNSYDFAKKARVCVCVNSLSQLPRTRLNKECLDFLRRLDCPSKLATSTDLVRIQFKPQRLDFKTLGDPHVTSPSCTVSGQRETRIHRFLYANVLR